MSEQILTLKGHVNPIALGGRDQSKLQTNPLGLTGWLKEQVQGMPS